MFIWAQSAGNGPLGVYIGRPELWGPKGVGVKGAIFMSGQFNILPVTPAAPAAAGAADLTSWPVPVPHAAFRPARRSRTLVRSPDRAVRTLLPLVEGAVVAASAVARRSIPRRSWRDPACPTLKTTTVKIMLATAELDPGINGTDSAFNKALHDELCKVGPDHCPTMLFEKGESHMSEVFSIDTPDKIVSGPILKWIKSTK